MSSRYLKPHSSYLRSLIALLLVVLSLPSTAEVQALLSHKSTQLDQPVRLTLQTDTDATVDPDLSVLEPDFEILGRSTQQSISVVNGRMSSKHALILTLLPRRAGELTIPALAIGSETTAPQKLSVAPPGKTTPQDGGPQAWLEMSVDKTSAYVEEAIILTLKTYLAPGIRGELVEIPQASIDDTQLKLLNEDRYSAVREGVEYRVVEQTFALYAYQTGKIDLSPAKFRGRSGVRTRAPFASLFSDELLFPQPSGRIVRAESNALSLDIKPIPASYTGKQWLPARNLQVVENIPDDQTSKIAGNPLSRRIMILADGLMSSQLPEVDLNLPEGLKAYPERPSLNDTTRRSGISGSLQQNLTLIATEPGQYHLPGVEIPWWNTETQQQEIARLPGRDIEFLPNPATAASPPPVQAAQPGPELSTPDIVRNAPLVDESDATGRLAWGLGLAWLATLIAWWLSHRRKSASATQAETNHIPQQAPGPSGHALLQTLELAYRERNAEAARRAWLAWAQATWPDNPPNNLARLCKRCDVELSRAVNALERALYSPNEDTDWSRYPVLELLQRDEPPDSPAENRHDRALIPLNP
ncbi:MAG: BatD family protein [Candidatus Thiodiazotropha sp.]